MKPLGSDDAATLIVPKGDACEVEAEKEVQGGIEFGILHHLVSSSRDALYPRPGCDAV